MPGSGVPTFVQGASDPWDPSTVNWITREFFELAEAPLSGNAVLAINTWNTNPNVTHLKNAAGTDVGTNIMAPQQPGATRWIEAWLVPNITSGNRKFSITTSHNNAMVEAAPQILEFYNVSQAAGSGAVDTSNAADVASTTTPRISLTTATAGCLIVVVGYCSNNNEPAIASYSEIDASWRLLAQNRRNGIAVAYCVQVSAGAISCGFNCGTAAPWTLVAIALKPANAGTAPTATPRVAFKQTELRNGTGGTWTSQLKPFGSTVVIETLSVDQGSGGSTVGSVVDDQSNAWAHPAHAAGSSGGTADAFVCDSMTPDTKAQWTLTFSSAPLDNVCHNQIIWDIIGGQYDTAAQATGQQTVAGNVSTVAITPTAAPGRACFLVGIDAGNIQGMVGAAFHEDMSNNDQANGSCGSAFSDNGAGHADYSTTAQLTAVWSNTQPAGGVNFWGAVAVAVKQAGTAIDVSATLGLHPGLGAAPAVTAERGIAPSAVLDAGPTRSLTAERAIAASATLGAGFIRALTAERALIASMNIGTAAAGARAFDAALALGPRFGLDAAANGAFEAAMTLARREGLGAAANADYFAAATLALALELRGGTGQTVDAALLLALSADATVNRDYVAEASIALQMLQTAAASAIGDFIAAVDIGRVLATTLAGRLVTAAGLSLDAVHSLAVAAGVAGIVVATPDGRTVTIRADDRNIAIAVDDRMIAVAAVDRVITIH